MASFRRNSIVPFMEGWLEKRLRPKFCNWWRKFWFVLNGKTLLCFKNHEESELLRNFPRKEFLNFTKVHAVRPIHNSSNKFSFEVVTKKSTVILAAINAEMRQKWIDALQSALQLSIISSPIQVKPCANPQNKNQFFGNKEYSLSQPNVSNRVRDVSGSIQRYRSFRQRRATMMSTENEATSKNRVDQLFEFGGSMERCRRLDTKNHLATIADDRKRSSVYRCTAVEFFTSDQNVNWPSLSMDIQDEIFQEVVLQHEEMKRILNEERKAKKDDVCEVAVTDVTEMSTQTEFSDGSSEQEEEDDVYCQCRELKEGDCDCDRSVDEEDCHSDEYR